MKLRDSLASTLRYTVRDLADDLVRAGCERLARALDARNPPRVITGGGDDPYLTKHRVLDTGDALARLLYGDRAHNPARLSAAEQADVDRIMRAGWRVHLHQFHRSDEDAELHNHPWAWAVSLVLVGGYIEELRVRCGGRAGGREFVRDRVVHRPFRPGSVNRLSADTFHRVELLGRDAWTLFVSGPIVQSWSFWSLATGQYTPWRQFIESKGYRAVETGP
jgi:hypothetical protein